MGRRRCGGILFPVPAAAAAAASWGPSAVVAMTLLVGISLAAGRHNVDRKEFCQFDSFEARCEDDSVIVMESAHYGRMRGGRCISGEGYIGCSADVRVYMDGFCSGRHHCVVSVTSLTDVVQPCRRDYTSYLEATYACKKVSVDDSDQCRQDKPVQLNADSGIIAGSSMLDSGARCVWQIAASPGQRVRFRLSVYRPGQDLQLLASAADGHHFVSADGNAAAGASGEDGGGRQDGCPWIVVVDDGETTVRESLCSRGSNQRDPVECRPRHGLACSVHLDWTGARDSDDASPIFVVHYEVVGCPDVELFNGAVVERTDGDELIVRCPDSRQTWYLTCGQNNKWIGDMFNCTAASKVAAGHHKIHGSSIPFPHGLIAAITLGLIFGLLIGTASLGALYIYRRRKRPPTVVMRMSGDVIDDFATTLPPDDYGGSEKLRLDACVPRDLPAGVTRLRPPPPPASTADLCGRLPGFDWAGPRTVDAILQDCSGVDVVPGGGRSTSPIYCPSSHRGMPLLQQQRAGQGGPADYAVGGAGRSCQRGGPMDGSSAMIVCGRPCVQLAYETPRLRLHGPAPPPQSQSQHGPQGGPTIAVDPKVYFELDSMQQQQRRAAGSLGTTPT